MIRTLTLSVAMALALGASAIAEEDQMEAEGKPKSEVENYEFSFEGPFGKFDQFQLQRGLQVFTQVCSACHGLKYVPLRTLGDEGGPGLPANQVAAYAEQNFEVFDADLEDFRPAKPTDNFPAVTGAGAPDLSTMAKARAGFHGPYGLGLNQFFKGMGGPEYIASILTGYTGKEKEEAGSVLYENTAFPSRWIAMAPPLYGDDVEYEDGSSTELEAEAKDVAAFLTWTAEPKLMARKQTGFLAVLFLGVLTVLLYLTNKRIWAPVKRRAKENAAK